MVSADAVVSETRKSPVASAGNSTALDQWRGLALVFVLISHGFYFTGRVYGMGRVGVNLFFFISGVLVFKSLTGHGDRTAWERTSQFWKRRLRRLFPALATYLLAMIPIVYALQNVPGAVSPSMSDYFHGVPLALLYAMDYSREPVMSLGHLWSLACEMQFYFLAPIIFLFGGKSLAQRKLVWGAILLALMTWGFVGAIRYPGFKYHFDIAVWPMMLGFCCEYRKDLFQRIPAVFFHWIILGSVVAFIVMTGLMFCGYEMKYGVIAIGTFVFLPCFLAYIGNRTLDGPIGRTLTWLGERTYSIYLWQQPFTICNYLPNILHPAGAAAAAFLGGIWFQFFESPFLSQKRRQVSAAPKFSGKKSRWTRLAWGMAVATVLGVIAAVAARDRYAATLAAKVLPTNHPSALNWNAGSSGSILLLGDSRIAMWNCPGLDGRGVVNAGFPGITTAQLAAGCGGILRQTHPQVVVIQVGINDLKLIGVRPDLREQVISNCVENVSAIALQSAHAGAHVIVTAVWPAGKVGLIRRFVWNSGVNSAVTETNTRLQHVLHGQTNIVFTDLFAEMAHGRANSDRQKLYSDTLHLNQAAYQQLTSLLQKKLPPAS
ncbi:MAG TPA: acyltransferase family protein [Verrucomicrobiae bacterium]|nr:acyltransferase family protein [Verrucomicrobiae bacterium]